MPYEETNVSKMEILNNQIICLKRALFKNIPVTVLNSTVHEPGK